MSRLDSHFHCARIVGVGLALMMPLIGLSTSGCDDNRCDACTASTVPNEGWTHVDLDSEITYEANPPASGPHYPYWAAWTAYPEAVPRGYWVHNLEHGGLVLLYRPDAPSETIQAMQALFDQLPDDDLCHEKLALLTPDPLLDTPVAAVTADHVLKGDSLSEADVLDLYEHCRCTAPEAVCSSGSY